jgi:hypothetical protein
MKGAAADQVLALGLKLDVVAAAQLLDRHALLDPLDLILGCAGHGVWSPFLLHVIIPHSRIDAGRHVPLVQDEQGAAEVKGFVF